MDLQRKPNPLPAWHFVDDADGSTLQKMGEAKAALGAEWRGSITFAEDGSPGMECNASNPTRQVIITAGDWLVMDYTPRVLSDAERVADYDEIP